MKIAQAQSLENRSRVVEMASAMSTERGCASASIPARRPTRWPRRPRTGLPGFVGRYPSREHRDHRADGGAIAVPCDDAARQSPAVQGTSESGIAAMLAAIERRAVAAGADRGAARSGAIGRAHGVGALVLSRARPDRAPLADEILETCRSKVLRHLPGAA